MRMLRQWLASSLLSFLFILAAALPAAATDLETVRKDFAPIDGYIIMPISGEYLVDIDAGDGAQVGDLLGVTQTGEKIVHPVTGQIIGSLDQQIAVLSITRIKSGYSYAKVVSGTTDLAKGTPFKRFAGVSAGFSGNGAYAAQIYRELSSALPELDWQGMNVGLESKESSKPEILFSYHDEKLEVRNSSGQVLKTYQISQTRTPGTTAPSSPSVTAPAPAAPISTVIDWPAESNPAPESAGQTYQPDYGTDNLFDTLPTTTIMADFVTTEEGVMLAATDGEQVYVFKVGKQLSQLAKYPFYAKKIHAVSWLQTSPGVLFLAVSASTEAPPTAGTTTETYPRSAILKFSEAKLTLVSDNLGYFLGTFDRDGNGTRETLLGQSLDLDIFYGQVRELRFSGDSFKTSAPDYDLPFPFPVQGSLFADLTGDGSQENVTVVNGLLTIYQGQSILFQSPKEVGGSISTLRYDTNPGQKDALFTTVAFEVTPIAADIDNDGQLELVAISTAQPTVSAPWNRNTTAGSWLSVFKYRNGRFLKGTLGKPFNNPLQGLFYHDNNVLIVEAPQSNQNKGSHIRTIPLSRHD